MLPIGGAGTTIRAGAAVVDMAGQRGSLLAAGAIPEVAAIPVLLLGIAGLIIPRVLAWRKARQGQKGKGGC